MKRLLLIITAAVFLFSCSSTKKSSYNKKTSTDSTTVTKNSNDSTKTGTTLSTDNSVTTGALDSDFELDFSNDTTATPTVINVVDSVNGFITITSPVAIKSIKQKKKEVTKTETNKKDSSSVKVEIKKTGSDSTTVKKVDTDVGKTVKRSHFPWFWMILGIILALLVIYRKQVYSFIKKITMNKIIPAFLAAFILQSCTKFRGTNIWVLGDGLWIVCLAFYFASIFSFIKAYKSSKSGSEIQDKKSGKWFDANGNVKIYMIGSFWFGVFFFALATVIIIVQYSSK